MRFARVLPTTLTVLLIATLATGQPRQRSNLDAESLIGEWLGMWKNREAGGRYDVTIEAVDG